MDYYKKGAFHTHKTSEFTLVTCQGILKVTVKVTKPSIYRVVSDRIKNDHATFSWAH